MGEKTIVYKAPPKIETKALWKSNENTSKKLYRQEEVHKSTTKIFFLAFLSFILSLSKTMRNFVRWHRKNKDISLIMSLAFVAVFLFFCNIGKYSAMNQTMAYDYSTQLSVVFPMELITRTDGKNRFGEFSSDQVSYGTAMQFAAEMVGVQGTPQWKMYSVLPEETKMLFKEISEEYGVNEAYILGICYNESRFNAKAINVSNSNGTMDWGIGQCNDSTFPTLQKRLGISRMEDILTAEKGIRACCVLFDYYKDMGLDNDKDTLLAYQEGMGNYAAVKQGKQKPWRAYENVLNNVKVYSKVLNCYEAVLA